MTAETREVIYENKHSAVNDFIERKQAMDRSPRTLNAYSRTLKAFFHEEFPDLAPEDVEVRHIEDYIGVLAARDLSQNTKRRYLESLSSFFGWAMKRPGYGFMAIRYQWDDTPERAEGDMSDFTR